MSKRSYKAPDGNVYPLTEAEYDIAFMAYKSDRKKAKIGDPGGCLLALGIRHNPDVQAAYIGSGKDAYVVFKARGELPARAVHFTVPSKAGKVRDSLETKGAPATQVIILRAPSAGRTLEARSAFDKKRRTEIKNGSPVKKRGPQKRKRIMILGVPHRPRARIVKNTVALGADE